MQKWTMTTSPNYNKSIFYIVSASKESVDTVHVLSWSVGTEIERANWADRSYRKSFVVITEHAVVTKYLYLDLKNRYMLHATNVFPDPPCASWKNIHFVVAWSGGFMSEMLVDIFVVTTSTTLLNNSLCSSLQSNMDRKAIYLSTKWMFCFFLTYGSRVRKTCWEPKILYGYVDSQWEIFLAFKKDIW